MTIHFTSGITYTVPENLRNQVMDVLLRPNVAPLQTFGSKDQPSEMRFTINISNITLITND